MMHLASLVLLACLGPAHCAKILGIGLVGCVSVLWCTISVQGRHCSLGCVQASHHLNLATVGERLSARGHSFDLVLAAEEAFSHRILAKQGITAVKTVTFQSACPLSPCTLCTAARPEETACRRQRSADRAQAG